jgi:hypothetical protein
MLVSIPPAYNVLVLVIITHGFFGRYRMGLVEEDLEPLFRARICDRQSEWGYWTSRVMGWYY